MKPIFNHFIKKIGLILTVLCIGIAFFPGESMAALDWQAPEMSDYVKVPPFATYSVKPNIMIMLDNSGSMNDLAYSGNYKGEPYQGVSNLSLPVYATYDDMEEQTSGTVYDSSNDLDFGYVFSALRFQGVDVPHGAIVLSADITFRAYYTSSVTTEMEIWGEASDNAAFLEAGSNNYNISSREVTSAMQSWTTGTWTNGNTITTPDLTAIVQEIVDRGGWETGNAMLFRLNSVGFPGVTSPLCEPASRNYGNSAYYPVLNITFVDPGAFVRYYGYYNPDYFYTYANNLFEPKYKKVDYDYATSSWKVEDLNGNSLTIDDADIAPAVKANGFWDGNFLNWVSMRRVDALRKVLMGGKATSRTGGGNQTNICEQVNDSHDKWFNSSAGPATTPYKGNYQYVINNGYMTVGGKLHTLKVQKNISIEPNDFFEGNLAGVLQRIGPRARWGNMWFKYGTGNNVNGAFIQNTIDNDFGTNFLPNLQDQACNTWTPLAESFYVAMMYYAQEDIDSSLDFPNNVIPNENDTQDPYYDNDEAEMVPCAKSFVLLLTDGASTMDGHIPNEFKDYDNDGKDNTACNEDTGTNCDYPSRGTDFLDDIALYARTNDLRSDLEGDQNVYLYTVYAFDDNPNARSLLRDASRNGGFEDLNGNGVPDGDYDDPASQRLEWDEDGDGDPDTYFEASDGYSLERELTAAINAILERASSGTAASVISNSRSGEGAVYQSIFYPANTVGANTVKWIGQVHALFSDAYGHLREDTNQNQMLDNFEDLYIAFDGTVVQKFDVVPKEAVAPVFEGGLSDINYLWTSTDVLNDEGLDPITQRNYTDDSTKARYIITFVDADNDMVADDGEVKDFTAVTDPSWADMADTTNYFAYLHPYPPFNPTVDVADANFGTIVSRQARRLVNFIRGQDQAFETVGGVNLPASRNRKVDYDNDGVEETWRLGDIVYSTPTVVSQPAEDYDLIYKDKTYSEFYRRYKDRRSVVYVGANDGMLHAFNGGFFDDTLNRFTTHPVDNRGEPIDDGHTYYDFPLGAELWAYIPYNLLPHLTWLQEPNYQHVYFMDLQPRIFDARIYEDGNYDPSVNPAGWATILVAGMRFGGGKIVADLDKTDGAYNSAVDKAMGSAFAIFDITNPEQPPKLLAEVTFPELGFTTCHPGVIPMRDFTQTASGDWVEQTNQWYLILGSGPASPDPRGVIGQNHTALIDATSDQNAVLYAIDLVDLANNNQVTMLRPAGPITYSGGAGPYYLTQFPEADSSVSRPIALDWEMDFNTDVLYFGLSFGDHSSGWGGKMRRLVMQNPTDSSIDPTDPTTWELDSTLIDLSDPVDNPRIANGQPIQATPTAGIDGADLGIHGNGNRWVFFGTGRFMSQMDQYSTDQQSYYGIMEPYTLDIDNKKVFNYSTVVYDDLMDVTDVEITVGMEDTVFWDLADEIGEDYSGWTMDLDYADNERNLGQAVLAGDILTFTSYMPSDELCKIGGQSVVYALYYRTGTAYLNSVIGTTGENDSGTVLKRRLLGDGLTITPNIHVGRQDGSTAYIQDSSAAIEELPQKNPGILRSGSAGWYEGDWTCYDE